MKRGQVDTESRVLHVLVRSIFKRHSMPGSCSLAFFRQADLSIQFGYPCPMRWRIEPESIR
jgi:hypothetical protein